MPATEPQKPQKPQETRKSPRLGGQALAAEQAMQLHRDVERLYAVGDSLFNIASRLMIGPVRSALVALRRDVVRAARLAAEIRDTSGGGGGGALALTPEQRDLEAATKLTVARELLDEARLLVEAVGDTSGDVSVARRLILSAHSYLFDAENSLLNTQGGDEAQPGVEGLRGASDEDDADKDVGNPSDLRTASSVSAQARPCAEMFSPPGSSGASGGSGATSGGGGA